MSGVPLLALLVALALHAACAAPGPVPALRSCDDGGEGGVMIDDVCL